MSHLYYYTEIRNILVWVGLVESSVKKFAKLLYLVREEEIKIKKIKIGSSSDLVGSARDNLGNYPIFSQLVLTFDLDDARIQDKLEVLDLGIGISNQKRFRNHGWLDAKGGKARLEQIEMEDEEDQIDEENQRYSFCSSYSKKYSKQGSNLRFYGSK
jgi:hypothetical protein